MTSNNENFQKPERITLRSIFHQFMLHLNLERGLGYTIGVLSVKPGKAIQQYLHEDRKKLMKPLSFAFLMVGLSTFLMFTLLEDGLLAQMELDIQRSLAEALADKNEVTIGGKMYDLIVTYRNALQLSGIPILALVSFLLFKYAQWNYAEHLVLGCYVIGYISWLSVLGAVLFYFTESVSLLIGISVLAVFYQIYFYWNVFRTSSYAFLRSLLLNSFYFSIFAVLMLVFLRELSKFL